MRSLVRTFTMNDVVIVVYGREQTPRRDKIVIIRDFEIEQFIYVIPRIICILRWFWRIYSYSKVTVLPTSGFIHRRCCSWKPHVGHRQTKSRLGGQCCARAAVWSGESRSTRGQLGQSKPLNLKSSFNYRSISDKSHFYIVLEKISAEPCRRSRCIQYLTITAVKKTYIISKIFGIYPGNPHPYF